jgi:HD-GYP domain-containing protein (c-di-GMP phosphodiesterase class II)
MDRITYLENKIQELTSLLEAAKELNSEIEIEEVLSNVLRQMVRFVKAEAGTLWILDEDGEEIRAAAAEGPSASVILNIRLGPGEGIVGKVIESGLPHLIEDATKDPSWAKRVDEASGFITHSMMTIPLVAKGKAIGAMQLLNKQGDKLFNQEDVDLALSLSHQASLALHNSQMYDELYRMSFSIIRTLAKTLDARDPYTAGHSERVSQYSLWIARHMGIDEDSCKELERAALLHDTGKIGIPDHILLKDSQLTNEEFEVIKTHTTIGSLILSNIEPKRLRKQACDTAHFHHERIDGSGYPNRLKGNHIPLFARIVAVADSFDAMTTVRPYSNGRSYHEAVIDLIRGRATQYDEQVIDAFAAIMKEKKYKINGQDRTTIPEKIEGIEDQEEPRESVQEGNHESI